MKAEKNREMLRMRYQDTNEFKRHLHKDIVMNYIERIRKITSKEIMPRLDLSCCERCGNQNNVRVHHKLYTFPVLREHLEVVCQSCHKKIHNNEEVSIIPESISYVKVCEVCSSIFKTKFKKQKCCSHRCNVKDWDRKNYEYRRKYKTEWARRNR